MAAPSWLREQERILKSNPQLAGLYMRPLWQELALPFQGLETDTAVQLRPHQQIMRGQQATAERVALYHA